MSTPWRLRVERGPNAGQSFAIEQASSTIGRQDNNTFVLDDARLSRQHARIDSGPNGLSVTDLNSANGTLVNGRPTSGSVPLAPGDRIQLGDTILVIEGGAAVSSGAAATMIAEPRPGSATSSGGGTPRLVVQGSGKVFALDRPSMVIGRQPDNDLPLEDTQSSRQHARFDIRDGQVTITDLGSANGTRVNGTRITAPTALNNGDVIQLGTSQLRLEGVAFVDHGTAAALGFYPPPANGPTLNAPPAFGGPPPPGNNAPLEGATVIGGPPPMMGAPSGPSSPPPLIGGGPVPPPPPGVAGPGWNSPPGPQFGGAPPPIQPPLPPTTPTQRKRSPLPMILLGLGVLMLLVCVVGAGGLFLASRRGNSDPTPTATVSSSGTAIPAANTTPLPAAGQSGGNTAPLPPGASPAPSPSAVPTVGAAPSAAPSTAASQPTRTPAASARASAAPNTGGRQTFAVETIGLRFSIPGDWRQTTNEAGRAGFVSGDGRSQLIVRWSTQVPSGLTAQQLIRQELLDTAKLDANFNASTVGTGAVTFGGQQGFGSEPYTFTQQGNSGTTRITEADRAVVLSGRAQYFFGFLALESAFDSYRVTFDEIIATIEITGP